MSSVRDEAVQMLEQIPEDKISLVVKYMQRFQTEIKNDDVERKRNALKKIQELAGRLPEDFDYKKELAEAREEKYGHID